MKNKLKLLPAVLCILLTAHVSFGQVDLKPRDFDQADEEENLNRQLWEFARSTPYDEMREYVKSAQRAAQRTQSREIELPNGWRILPGGRQVEVGHLPYEAIVFADRLVVLNTGYYFKEPQEVSVVNIHTAQVEKTFKINSLFPSAVIGPDGDLYISGGYDQKIYRINRKFTVVREYAVQGFAGGVAQIGPQQLAIGYMAAKNSEGNYISGKLAILDTVSGKIELEKEIGYFPYSVKLINQRLYVTLLGENKLLVFDPQLNFVKALATGRTPQEMCNDAETAFVANTGSDSLSVVDLRRNEIVRTLSMTEGISRFGRTPTSCAVDGNRLYVTLAGVNAVAVLDKRNGRELGLIPTAWYPTKVIDNGDELLILNGKGMRARRPNPDGPQPIANSRQSSYVLNLLQGTVSIVSKHELPKSLSAWTRQARNSSPLMTLRSGVAQPPRYIFYIVKENRTYDQVLGDLGRGNGDPKLTIFGEDVSPVHHQLARDFVTLDNFFANGEISVLGHSFTTSGYASPFLEWVGNLAYSSRWKGYPFGTVPAVTSPAYLWDILEDKGVDYRVYGENYFLFTRAYRILVETFGADSSFARKFYDNSVKLAHDADRGNAFYQFALPFYGKAVTRATAFKLLGQAEFASGLSRFLNNDESLATELISNVGLRRRFADYLYHYPFNYRSWNLRHSDLDRAMAWKVDFESQLKAGNLARFHYIWLPNDHTDGSSDRILNPFQFVAQNDAALGRIIETISHSSVWRNSLIFVVEDDAQNGPDHVDATRTVAFAIGPHIKRSALVSDRYDQLSMLRTMELLLGLKSLNLGDRLAVPMYGIFAQRINLRPFVPDKVSEKLSAPDREKYLQMGTPATR
ncbi:MAG: bifunctional YncE family protein/alkaline phosphatase family protein [Pyrinomonadaceae bacterium]